MGFDLDPYPAVPLSVGLEIWTLTLSLSMELNENIETRGPYLGSLVSHSSGILVQTTKVRGEMEGTPASMSVAGCLQEGRTNHQDYAILLGQMTVRLEFGGESPMGREVHPKSDKLSSAEHCFQKLGAALKERSAWQSCPLGSSRQEDLARERSARGPRRNCPDGVCRTPGALQGATRCR